MGGKHDVTEIEASSLADQIDRLCDEFEQHWREGEEPRIEEYLDRVDESHRGELLNELIGIEFHWRRNRDREPQLDEYFKRFPEYSEVIEQQVRTRDNRDADTLGLRDSTGDSPIEPRRFGDYDLLEEIGRGGMGVVYRARQRNANRIVALEAIRRDWLESLPAEKRSTTVERFQHEAQATARLQHDHVVPVYDVGEVDGHHFYSMRLIEGRSLAEMLRDGPIANHTAAKYLESVARGVHEAHSHGILHRDLKPQNILVDAKSDRALVSDFGLAKWTEGAQDMTRTGEVVGTPSHMSPEQASDSSQVVEQTDVYALGATLYHILAGRPPFQAATTVETLQQVLNDEPVPLRQLNPAISRDLETICIKCLQKEPWRRYETAEMLADDLGRYLRGEPIQARPIGAFGRVLRWRRRHPVTAVWIGVAAVFLVLALITGVVGWVNTSRALVKSNESFRNARGTVHKLLTLTSEEELLNRPGMQPIRRKLLDEALNYYEKFLAQRGNDPTLRDEVAAAHFRVGMIVEELESPDKALPSFKRARDLQRRLVVGRKSDESLLDALGKSLNRIGRALHQMREFDSAANAHREALDIRTRLVKSAPKNPHYQSNVANSHMNLGLIELERRNFDEARRLLDHSREVRQELFRTRPDDIKIKGELAMDYYNMAKLAIIVRKDGRAEYALLNAISLFQNLVDRDSQIIINQFRLAACYRVLADLKSEMGDSDAALPLYESARQHMELLASENPDVPEYKDTLAGLYLNLGELQQDSQNVEAAMKCFRSGQEILDTLVKAHPEVSRYRRDLAAALRVIGLLEMAAGDLDQARANLDAALRHQDELVRQFPDNQDFNNQRNKTLAAIDKLTNSQVPKP